MVSSSSPSSSSSSSSSSSLYMSDTEEIELSFEIEDLSEYTGLRGAAGGVSILPS